MTRSAVIGNTSNHDGEDYEFVMIGEYGVENKILKPGETFYLPVYNERATIVMIPRTSKTPEPFYDDEGKHKMPKWSLEIE